jgi:bisphosphoglycerate-dependent phosphoglycerate mutase|tara:strand:+ start:706 stop:918 length:213 start_codon:yes stop_codon:yes gene_type:complete
MITIDDVEYKEDDLSEISKIHVKRINDLRTEVVNLQMMLEEKNVLISAYANAIKESVKEVEETDAEVVNE